MGISRISQRKKKIRYFSNPCFLSPKTLKPLFSSYSFHQRLSFCNSSSSCSPSISGFDSNLLHKQPDSPSSSCEFFPKCGFDRISRVIKLYSSISSDALAPTSRSNSVSLRRKHYLLNPLSGFSSKCSSLPGLSLSLHSFYPFSQSLKRLSVLNFSSSSDGSVCTVSSIHCSRRSFGSSTRSTLNSSDSNKLRNIVDLEQRCSKNVVGSKVKLSSSVNPVILEIIKSGNDYMDYNLNLTGARLEIKSIKEIFRFLNCHKISGLRFFKWLRWNNPKWHFSAKVCSQIISNCGYLGDFDTMRLLLDEFRSDKICLDENAFSFLHLFNSSEDSLMKSVRRIVLMLNEVGGSCRNSGIWALIEMCCNLDLFDMAEFVIQITEKKDAYYNILIRQRCKKGHLEEAYSIVREIQDPTTKNYNYLLGSLCKNDKIDEAYSMVEEMERKGILLDEITYEILIHSSCISGKLDSAKQLLDKMVSSSLQPRLHTHRAFLKAFFKAELYEDAHNYVIDCSVNYQQLSPALHSLLAKLHQGKGHLMNARDVIVQMMDKGLRPNFRVYVKLHKELQKTGKQNMAEDLKFRVWHLKSSPLNHCIPSGQMWLQLLFQWLEGSGMASYFVCAISDLYSISQLSLDDENHQEMAVRQAYSQAMDVDVDVEAEVDAERPKRMQEDCESCVRLMPLMNEGYKRGV